MGAERVSAHVVCEEEVREVDCLFNEATGRGHDRGNHVNILSDVCHSEPLGLTNENVTPDGHG